MRDRSEGELMSKDEREEVEEEGGVVAGVSPRMIEFNMNRISKVIGGTPVRRCSRNGFNWRWRARSGVDGIGEGGVLQSDGRGGRAGCERRDNHRSGRAEPSGP